MSSLGVCGAACAGLCVGGGCAAQIGLLVWQALRKPKDERSRKSTKRSSRSRKTKRDELVIDEEVRSEELSDREEEDADIPNSPRTAIPIQNQRQKLSRQQTGGQNMVMEQENDFMGAGWQGFSMEDARNLADEAHSTAMTKTPGEVLSDMQRGNARFWMGVAKRPEKSAFHRRALLTKQFPNVAVLSCSDSRVPVEIVFDVGLGDMFVVRVAGNCLDTSSIASLQYAVHHLKVKVLVVMGHEGCGAVKAAGLPPADINREPESLGHLLRTLGQGLNQERLSGIRDKRAQDREAVVSNVHTQVGNLTKDFGIMKKVHEKELIIVGAFYEISSGIVDFFDEVSEDVPSGGFHQGVSSSFSETARPSETARGELVPSSPQIFTPTASLRSSARPLRRPTLDQRQADGQASAQMSKSVGGVRTFLNENPSMNNALGG